jgi:CubicO group peptidase (beta-lactamase class C family)
MTSRRFLKDELLDCWLWTVSMPAAAIVETAFERACKRRDIQGVVLVAASSDGTKHIPVSSSERRTLSGKLADEGETGRFEYDRAFGRASPDEHMLLDSTFRIASCSKLLTSIAALQCVERVQITLDEDVSPILPELARLSILEGCEKESGQLLLRQRKTTKLTLRS